MGNLQAIGHSKIVAFLVSTTIGFLLIPVFLFIGVMWIQPSFSSLGILVALLVLVFLVAAFEPGVSVGNGFGTALRGNHPTPAGHIATKWVVMAYAPLIPIRSYEVVSSREIAYQNWFIGYSQTSEFRYRRIAGGLYWPQVRPTVLVILGIVILPMIILPILLHAL